jgi:hypothetical protein
MQTNAAPIGYENKKVLFANMNMAVFLWRPEPPAWINFNFSFHGGTLSGWLSGHYPRIP